MLKKILYTVLFIVLATGAVYSYQKVDFSRKTVMFFQVFFGGENAMGGPGGAHPMGDNRGGEMQLPGGQAMGAEPQQGNSEGQPAMGENGERSGPPNMQQGGNPPTRPEGNGGPGGHGGPGGASVNLKTVGLYTVIMTFMTMLTVLLDNGIRSLKRARKVKAA